MRVRVTPGQQKAAEKAAVSEGGESALLRLLIAGQLVLRALVRGDLAVQPSSNWPEQEVKPPYQDHPWIGVSLQGPSGNEKEETGCREGWWVCDVQ